VKIATFNINNVNSRLANLLAWLKTSSPDVACLQELKADDRAFPAQALRDIGYHAVWSGERAWNGVAILARDGEPIVTQRMLPGDPKDKQSRYIEAAVRGMIIGCLYLPNGNPQPGPKFTYKLAWFERLQAHAKTLLKQKVPVVLAGDYNVVPTAGDIYETTSYDDNALVQPESRRAYAKLLAQGWTDALRTMHPTQADLFTYWGYLRNRWPRNAGLRLDHILLSPDLAPKLKAAGVDKWVRGEPGASDHAPVWVELSDKRAVRRAPLSGGSGSPSRGPSPRRRRASR